MHVHFPEEISGLPEEEVYAALGTRPEGLTQQETLALRAECGPNVVPEPSGQPLAIRFLSQLGHFLALLLWLGGALAFIAGMPELGWAIFAVILINAIFSFFQEYQAEHAVAALRKLLPSRARVRRQGRVLEVPAEDLVPGDILLLGEGDRLSVDARIVLAYDLQMDQSAFTGESRLIGKTAYAQGTEDAPVSDLQNLVFASTTVATGLGEAVVYATGPNTQFGRVVHFSQRLAESAQPVTREIRYLTRWLALLAILLGAVCFVLGALVTGLAPARALLFALGIIVANVPEGLLPTVTLALAMGVQRMARRKAIVRHLPAVETLGCTTVICSDKTGTLTENQMSVVRVYVDGQCLSVTGGGYEPAGAIQSDQGSVAQDYSDALARLLRCAAFCNNAQLLPPDDKRATWSILGDPTEGALLALASKGGLSLENDLCAFPRTKELTFDPARKRMTSIHREGGSQVAYVKGAPLELLSISSHVACSEGVVPLDAARRGEVALQNDALAAQTLRILGLAYRVLPENLAEFSIQSVEHDLVFLGLVALEDPPRPEVPLAIALCQQAGIRVIMITGDYAVTAEALAKRLHLAKGQVRVITGAELHHLSDDGLTQALQQEVVFARAAPGDKLRIVEALQRQQHVVAVTATASTMSQPSSGRISASPWD